MTGNGVPEIFDPQRLALRRQRAERIGDGFLRNIVEDAIVERLGDISRPFATGVFLDGSPASADRLSHATGIAFTPLSSSDLVFGGTTSLSPVDCVIWPGGLESLSDVPGALARARNLLKPDGVLIGAYWGGDSLSGLRAIMAKADGDTPRQRLHPQIDVKAMGDLLQRTGYALPMIDREIVTLRYRDLAGLIGDLRGSALTNVLAGPPAIFGKAAFERAKSAFEDLRNEDGRVQETMMLVHFTGWRPDPSQPQPAKRGSATQSLAAALRPRDESDSGSG